MYLNVYDHRKSTIYYLVLDLDKRKEIKRCIWADDVTGKYCVHATDADGKYLLETDDLGRVLTGVNRGLKTIIKRGRIKLINTKG